MLLKILRIFVIISHNSQPIASFSVYQPSLGTLAELSDGGEITRLHYSCFFAEEVEAQAASDIT